MDYILWLPSWYPNRLSPFNGDFIQRHAQAAALINKIDVIYIVKDKKKTITNNFHIDENITGNLTEKLVYYNSLQTGIGFIDKLISYLTYKKIYKKVVSKHFSEKGYPSMVHVHVAMKAGLIAVWLKKSFKIPFVLSEHWTGYYKVAKQNIYNSGIVFKNNIKKIISNAIQLLPVTKHLGDTINDNVYIPYKVIPNVVDTKYFFYTPASNSKFQFIHVSTLNHHKNAEGIIRTAKLMADEGFDFELIIIGSVNKEITSLVDDLKMNNIIILKNEMPYEEVAKEMQCSSAFVLFSRVENLPCVILEALCCGLPVISSNVGGIKEVIDESNGILVESENELQLKNAMIKVFENYFSYNRKVIAEKAISKFNYNAIAEEINDIYKNFNNRIT